MKQLFPRLLHAYYIKIIGREQYSFKGLINSIYLKKTFFDAIIIAFTYKSIDGYLHRQIR